MTEVLAGEQTWGLLLSRLRTRLKTLVPGDFLTLSEESFGRSAPARYVQLLLCNQGLVAEVVGPAYWPSTAVQQELLLLAGWAAPDEVPGYPTSNYVRCWNSEDGADAANACVEALQILGADPAGAWSWSGRDA